MRTERAIKIDENKNRQKTVLKALLSCFMDSKIGCKITKRFAYIKMFLYFCSEYEKNPCQLVDFAAERKHMGDAAL